MKVITPQGDNILVMPIQKENEKTEAGIELLDTKLAYGIVMERSVDYEGVYEKGNTVIYAADAGITQHYNKKSCLWLNAKGFPQGHILCIVEDK